MVGLHGADKLWDSIIANLSRAAKCELPFRSSLLVLKLHRL
jgi:hypothetical protein